MSRGGFTTLKCLYDRKVSFVGNAKSEVPKCNVCPGRVSPVLSWILHATRSVQNVRESTKCVFDTTVVWGFYLHAFLGGGGGSGQASSRL